MPMNRLVQVCEFGCGKWIKMEGIEVFYTSNRDEATKFSIRDLVAANQLTDFRLYKRTMIAVPVNGNAPIEQCGSVSSYIEEMKNVSDYTTHGF